MVKGHVILEWGVGIRHILENFYVILKGKRIIQTANNLYFQSFRDTPACCKYFAHLLE